MRCNLGQNLSLAKPSYCTKIGVIEFLLCVRFEAQYMHSMHMDTLPQLIGPRLHMRIEFITVQHFSVRTPAVIFDCRT
jgi:hypothetical protein